jgi:transcriptional regulator with XRE-family HTH domain
MAIYFKENLKHIRAAYDLSQKALSESWGCNYKAYQSYELGRCQAPYETLEAISLETGIGIDELLLTDMGVTVSHLDIMRKKRVKKG